MDALFGAALGGTFAAIFIGMRLMDKYEKQQIKWTWYRDFPEGYAVKHKSYYDNSSQAGAAIKSISQYINDRHVSIMEKGE